MVETVESVVMELVGPVAGHGSVASAGAVVGLAVGSFGNVVEAASCVRPDGQPKTDTRG